MSEAWLSTTYFGPVQWYQKLNRTESIWIEQWESFLKQTYRNRCLIATTQGVQALTVPVVRGETSLIRDIRISDHGNWRHLHWNALQSAYGESPFFEYYQDDIRPFFEQRWAFLLDFNEAIRSKMCELIDIQPQVHYTSSFVRQLSADSQVSTTASTLSSGGCPPSDSRGLQDFREAINPKHPAPDAGFIARPYYQVYRQKHGFLPNLSILDLLFNMGPESVLWL